MAQDEYQQAIARIFREERREKREEGREREAAEEM